ncbi:hypothetical protein RhiirA4_477510 [Rhizophagus irregularis]|uniref:Uncharacterized protein n=1 Tax=Rhizophagus irregularis TaxID=588596 RepID=A0A2I1HDD6_9GLOM|nr:hypothetical protein RhiirA4_477510 [Rhizophagus irregularis]
MKFVPSFRHFEGRLQESMFWTLYFKVLSFVLLFSEVLDAENSSRLYFEGFGTPKVSKMSLFQFGTFETGISKQEWLSGPFKDEMDNGSLDEMDTRNSSLNYSKTKWTRDFGTPKLSEISKQFLVLQFYGNGFGIQESETDKWNASFL